MELIENVKVIKVPTTFLADLNSTQAKIEIGCYVTLRKSQILFRCTEPTMTRE